jgi:hypothetical protein
MSNSLIASIWHRLQGVHTLTSQCASRQDTGWNGRGEGRVLVEHQGTDILVFNEDGYWHGSGGAPPLPFHNVYRWTLGDNQIALEHLRLGAAHPVFLVDFIPTHTHLQAAAPHPCRDDRYDALLSLDDDALRLIWTVKGPSKDERLAYAYR